MRILEINAVLNGSTGRIMLMIADMARKRGHEVIVAVPHSHTNMKQVEPAPYKIGHILLRNIGAQLAYYTGYSGCFNFLDTKSFLKYVEGYKPDIIHLHNLHSEYINLSLLFSYIKSHNIPVVWTLHDCWSFTGGCAHFVLQKCNKWQDGCYGCKIHRQYPGSYFDNTKKMWKLKKKWFTGVPNLTVVTPSVWLEDFAKQSYLGEYPTKTIHNGIDLSMFKPCDSEFRKRYGIEDKKLVLGVSMGWDERKGIDVMIKLSEILPDDYVVVIVGTVDTTKYILADNIVSIARTESQKELCEVYSTADVFVNPTREDNFPTVNIEALACGTPVVTFKTGGSPECIDETCGIVVEVDDVNATYEAIINICENRPYSEESCVNRAKLFDQYLAYNSYVNLFESISF